MIHIKYQLKCIMIYILYHWSGTIYSPNVNTGTVFQHISYMPWWTLPQATLFGTGQWLRQSLKKPISALIVWCSYYIWSGQLYSKCRWSIINLTSYFLKRKMAPVFRLSQTMLLSQIASPGVGTVWPIFAKICLIWPVLGITVIIA